MAAIKVKQAKHLTVVTYKNIKFLCLSYVSLVLCPGTLSFILNILWRIRCIIAAFHNGNKQTQAIIIMYTDGTLSVVNRLTCIRTCTLNLVRLVVDRGLQRSLAPRIRTRTENSISLDDIENTPESRAYRYINDDTIASFPICYHHLRCMYSYVVNLSTTKVTAEKNGNIFIGLYDESACFDVYLLFKNSHFY